MIVRVRVRRGLGTSPRRTRCRSNDDNGRGTEEVSREREREKELFLLPHHAEQCNDIVTTHGDNLRDMFLGYHPACCYETYRSHDNNNNNNVA
jgi:hypothetical protein